MVGDVNLAFLGSLGRSPSWCWCWKVILGKKGSAGALMLLGGFVDRHRGVVEMSLEGCTRR